MCQVRTAQKWQEKFYLKHKKAVTRTVTEFGEDPALKWKEKIDYRHHE